MIFAADWIAFHADRMPEKTAIIDQHSGQQFSYAALHERVGRLAAWLRDSWGLRPGDRVAVLGKNSPQYYEVQFACWRLGAIMLPLNWRLAEPELLYILNDAEPVGLIYDAEFASQAAALRAGSPAKQGLRIDTDGPADDDTPPYEEALQTAAFIATVPPDLTHDTPITIMYTSGTTGHPKGVLITYGMTFWNVVNISVPTGLNHESVYYVVLPTFHTAGLNLYANPVFHWGGTNIIAREFDAGRALHTLSVHGPGVTHFFGVPAIYLFMQQHPDFAATDLSGVRSWGCGGAPMPVVLLRTYAERGIVIQPGFGMTETSPTVFLADPRRALEKPASVGRPLLHVRARIVDEHFRDLPPGSVGELVISGPNVTPGYWKRPDADAASFTVDEHGQRWLHSGDAGLMDEAGCFFIVDRYKDMYISGGENVYPAEVEQVIYHMPQVADAAVIGIPHEKWGETGLALVVCREGAQLSEQQVIEHCRQHLARYKVPQSVVFVAELPRTAAGKVLKRVLREQFGR